MLGRLLAVLQTVADAVEEGDLRANDIADMIASSSEESEDAGDVLEDLADRLAFITGRDLDGRLHD